MIKINVLQNFLLFCLYFSSLNLKYLKLTIMDITRFAMNLHVTHTSSIMDTYVIIF